MPRGGEGMHPACSDFVLPFPRRQPEELAPYAEGLAGLTSLLGKGPGQRVVSAVHTRFSAVVLIQAVQRRSPGWLLERSPLEQENRRGRGWPLHLEWLLCWVSCWLDFCPWLQPLVDDTFIPSQNDSLGCRFGFPNTQMWAVSGTQQWPIPNICSDDTKVFVLEASRKPNLGLCQPGFHRCLLH